ncbi:FAD-binding domain-containing protein [Thelonectria olida]|uniref:FAD-binding domain-containing protein n=1 Tax=Thelonectria olida TaxID=1576542 RepID=A0A9P8VV72_9HYPO|nr:FAD-binding domain-containing protein [Thelonectria olida]
MSTKLDQGTHAEILPGGTVLIAGGGPVGLLLARVLSFYGVKSVLFERNDTTTKWPKMDLTNARSMELLRKLGLADDLRKHGVPSHLDQNVLMSTGLHADEAITRWELPGVDKFRKEIQENNNGTQPLEPWQRISQSIFERWLRAICEKDPLIDVHYSHKVESVAESKSGAEAVVINVKTGATTVYQSNYIAGCDGASSKVREALGIKMGGGPIPTCVLLVHFKSRDLTRLHKQGRFWHIFLVGESGGFEGAIISQDEEDTWTTHLFMPLDAKPDEISSEDAIYRVLGGLHGRFEISIDKILVRSVWRPTIAVAEEYSTQLQRVFLAGDSAHQNIPTGGYGMNMGIGDAFDLGWKLATVIKGHAGSSILKTYDMERRPVALRNVEHSGVHFAVHSHLKELLSGNDPRLVDEDTEAGRALRKKIHDHYQANDGENRDFGIEMGYRYTSPIVLRQDGDGPEPLWSARQYTPSSWPGGRAPHVFLSDGSALFDKFGKFWTLLVFAPDEVGQGFFTRAATDLCIPLTVVNIANEEKAAELYERRLVLIRPDEHVAWRSNRVDSIQTANSVLQAIAGRTDADLVENKTLEPLARATMPARLTALI